MSQQNIPLEQTKEVSNIRTWQAAFARDKLPDWLPVIHVEPPLL